MTGCVFAVAVFSTFFCAAVNAYTLRIGYPLWRLVGRAEFGALHREYLRVLNPIITVPHVLMFFADGALLWRRPALLPMLAAVVVSGLATAVTLISAFVAGPVHDRFARNGAVDAAGMRRLIVISAWRTAMMLGASAVLGWAVARGV